MKRLSLSMVTLVLMIWTASYAQVQKNPKDTIRCYGLTELRDIAATLVYAKTCDTLLLNAKNMLANRDSMIKQKDFEISKQSSQLLFKDNIIGLKDEEITSLTKSLNTANKHKKLLFAGWGSTSLVLTGFIIYFAIK